MLFSNKIECFSFLKHCARVHWTTVLSVLWTIAPWCHLVIRNVMLSLTKNSLKRLFWGFKVVQGHRCTMLVPLESSSAVLAMICSKSASICNRFHARWGTPLWCPRSRGTSSPSGTKLPHQKLETLCYHMVKTRSLYLTWAWYTTGSWQTDGQADGQTEFP